VDVDDERVFGGSQWLKWKPSTSMPSATPFFVYSQWSLCTQSCDPEMQTRDATCINASSDDQGVAACMTMNVTMDDVERDCGHPSCAVVPISITQPKDGDVFRAGDDGTHDLKYTVNGGLRNFALNVSLCSDGETASITCEAPDWDTLRCISFDQIMPGQTKSTKVDVKQFQLDRQYLRLLGAQFRLVVWMSNESLTDTDPAVISRRAFTPLFTIAAGREYKLSVPKNGAQPKSWMAFGSAGVSDGQSNDDQLDIGEVQYVWASEEFVQANPTGVKLVISSKGNLLSNLPLGHRQYDDDTLALEFNTTSLVSTCAPNSGLKDGNCTADFELLPAPTEQCATPPAVTDSPSNSQPAMTAVAGSAATLAASYLIALSGVVIPLLW